MQDNLFAVKSKKKSDLDQYQYLQFVMGSLHELIFRSLEQILYHLDHDKVQIEADLDNWLGYVGSWVYFVSHHHRGEETYMFPVFEKHGYSMDEELSQHEKIHKDIENISKALEKYKADKKIYDGKELKSLFLECKPNLYEHLGTEVAGFTKEKMGRKISEQVLKSIFENWKTKIQNETDPSIALPFLVYHTPSYNYWWADLPKPIHFIVVPLISLKHRGWWKYCPKGQDVFKDIK